MPFKNVQLGKHDGKDGEQQILVRNGKYYIAIKVGQRWMYTRLVDNLNDADLLVLNNHLINISNPHEVTDTQVNDNVGKSGHVSFVAYDPTGTNLLPHEVYITKGRITSWLIDTDEQLS